MRYNVHYHAHRRENQKHRRLRLTSFIILAVTTTVMAVIFRSTPLDASQLLNGFVASLARVTVAYALALIVAILLGIVSTTSSAAEDLFLPVLDVAQSFPSFALLPILVFYFGQSSLSVIVILVIAMVWPILFSIIGGIKEQRQDQSEAAQIFGAKGWRYLRYYRLPMLRPSLMTGSIVSWGEAWDVIVGAEIIAQVHGAGHYLGVLGRQGQTGLLLMGVLIYLILIFSINQLVWLPLLHRYTMYQSES